MVALVIARKIASEAKWNAMHAAKSGTFLAQKRSDGAKKTRATHAVEDTSEDYDLFALHNCGTAEAHKIKSSQTEPIWIHPKVNGCQLPMELDTGSALTVMPAIMFDEHFDLPLQPTSPMLKPYASDRLRPRVCFAHTCATTARSLRPARTWSTLMDCFVWRDWLQNIVFDWRSVHNIKVNATSASLSDGMRSRYATSCAHIMLLCSALAEVICNPDADISRSTMVLKQSF